jgi:hypothetical protein
MNLSPVEAVGRINESVTVEMLVRKTKRCCGSRKVFLDSETDYHDPRNLGVVVSESVWAQFSQVAADAPTDEYVGKTIRVRGVVILNKDRPYVEVDEPGQIELLHN